MHLKFLARGTGSAAAAAAYLLAEWDAAGTRRAAVEVLRGDPHEVAAVADGLPFKHRYTSGLMAWSPEDAPTRAELERVVDEFEETAWTGLERDRYVWAVILHRDHDGGVHLHIFAARCDLATGRSLNIAPPGWQKTFDPLRDALNFEHGWSRPDDPARARPNRPAPYRAYLDAETLRAGWEVEPNPRELIGQHLMARVAAGTVTDRAGVVGALEELDLEVTRQGEHYVTARHPETGDRWRLKGTLYERDFDRERFVRQQAPEPSGDREPADRGDAAARAAEAWQDVEEQRGQRAKYHQARYGRGSREGRARARDARDAAGDVERESRPAASASGREAGAESLAGHLRRELGDDAVVAAEDSAAEQDRELEAIRGAAAGDATACLAVLARVSVVHDRDRASTDSGLASVVRAVRAGAEAAGRADRGLAGADRVLAAAGRAARGCGDALDRGIRDAGPDLWRAVSKRVAGREQAVCATSKGEQWLVEAQQTVLEGADRPLTWAGRVRAVVETVEGRLDADLAGREESLAATLAGSVLLQEVYGEGGAAAAPLQSFAKREAVLDWVEQRVREALTAREEALQPIPFGRQCLSAAAEGRPGDAEGVAETLAEWESRVRGAEERVGEELDRLEKELVAIAAIADLLAASAGALVGDGRTLSFVERWEAYERAKSGFEEELDREEAAIREDSAGEEFLHDARLEVLGGAGRETATLERARIVKAAAEAKRHAEEKWNEEKAARVEKLGALGLDLYHAHLADLDPTTREHVDAAMAAAESDDTRLERLRAVLSDEAAAARYREVLAAAPGQFNTADLDRALVAGEREREHLDALETATEAAQAAAARSHVKLHDDAIRAIHETGETHEAGIAAVERTTAALAAAADQQLPSETIIDTWQAHLSDPGEIAAALDAVTAAAREEQERKAEAEEAGRVAALRTTTEAAQAAAARSHVKLHDDAIRAIHETGETHEAGIAAVERTTAALAAAADQQLPSETIIDTWQAHLSDPGEIAAALDAVTAAAREEQERKAEAEEAERVAALRTATEAAQAAAARSHVKLHDDAIRAIHETGETHAAGLAAVERTTAAFAAAADQQLPSETIVETWNANESDPGEIAPALEAATAAAREERRKAAAQRQADLEAATEAAQAEAARSRVELRDAHVRTIYETGATHEVGLAAVKRTTAALAAAADQRLPSETIIDTWQAHLSDPGGIAPALDAVTAAAREEQERKAEAEEAGRVAALRTATEAAQAEAARSHVKLHDDAIRAIHETGETHAAGLAAVERTTAAFAAAADQQLPSETIVETWNANESDPGEIAPALEAATAAAREERRKAAAQRQADLEAATEAAQAEAARSRVELRDAHVRTIYETGATHEVGLAAVKRTTAALAAAADQRLPSETIIDTWQAHLSDPGGIAPALDAVTAAAREEQERKAEAEEAGRVAALRTATEAAQAEAARSHVKLHDDAIRAIHETGETHAAGLAAVKRTTAALAAAADQQLPRKTIIDTWKANWSDPGGIAPALDAATADAVRREEERKAPAAPSTPRQVPAIQVQQADAAEQERKARDKRWEALPDAAQDEARARFDQLEPGREGALSAQRSEQVVGDVENLVAKTYDREEYQLRERRREWHPTDKNGDELLKRAQIDTFGTDREPVNLRERGAVLDAANVLDAADRGFESANRQIEERLGITPSHASVREAAADTANTSTTGWLRKVMDAIASGKAKPMYDDPGPESENTEIRQKCIDDNRAVNKRAADKQHAQEMKDWQALGAVRRRFTPKPERPEPKDPNPPTPKEITGWRSHVLRWARKAITDAAEYCKGKISPADHLRTTLRTAQRHEPTHDQDRGGIQR